MKNSLMFGLSILFLNAFAQETKFEVAAVGFYNLENLFDTDSSMQITNVDKLQEKNPDYTHQKDYDASEYYGSTWKNQFENVKVEKKKLDFSIYPEFPVSGLTFYKPKRKEYNKNHNTNFTKKEFLEEIENNESLFSKKEFKEFIDGKETITLKSSDIYWRINDTENTPSGKRQYTDKLYEDKLNNLADVISSLAKDYTKDGVALLGLAEIENKRVLEDLIQTGELKKMGFAIEQHDGMYSRGVDVGLLYQTKYFEVIESHSIILPYYSDKKKHENRYFTRDILWVEGELLGEPVHVFVNHWPSRRGGETKSSYGRELGAQMVRNVMDSLMAIDPNTQIIVMGDLNDDPTNKSAKSILGAARDIDNVTDGGMYNPLYKDYKKGYGSLGYRGSWNLFDQIIVSSSFVKDEDSWNIQDAEIVYDQDWINRFGGYEGSPNRSFGGNYYQGGYSDHLPSVVYLKRKQKQDKDKDGIADENDSCPEEAGLKEFNGCPDTDKDGIADADDKCAEEAGPKENNGCPYKDSDNDGVLDKDDKCPQTKGMVANDGCPEVKEEVKEVLNLAYENITFETNSDIIIRTYNDELVLLAKTLKENPQLLLTIEGHTDNVGNEETNLELSKDRANAVKNALVKDGVDENRITVLFYGETKPTATNETAEGRQINRRVNFKVTYK